MKDFIRNYFNDIKNTLDELDPAGLETVIRTLAVALHEGRQIFTMGNGGSGATASHLVCDLNKGVSHGTETRFKTFCLNDNMPTVLAYANDVSYTDIFSEQLKNFMAEGDIVIAFSGSGNSENILKAVDYANSRGGTTIGFSGYGGGRLAELAQISIAVPVEDMQKAEDIHFILCHLIMQALLIITKEQPE